MSKAPGYAVIGIYKPGKRGPQVMSHNNKIIVFDTPDVARQFIPLLGAGRMASWGLEDHIYWHPIDPDGINHACVLTDYDVYNLPPPFISESLYLSWKHHIIWSDWYSGYDIVPQVDNVCMMP